MPLATKAGVLLVFVEMSGEGEGGFLELLVF